jgi:cell filamentation protein
MKKSGRYETSKLIEDQYEPGTRKSILKNLLGIRKKREMDRIEAAEQLRTLNEQVNTIGKNHRFTTKDICKIHKSWLGSIYQWAGDYRSVNISKGDFTFAFAGQIPKLMADLEKKVLFKYTPCSSKIEGNIAEALGIVHAELILIHPFRDGNGRLARMLSVLMAQQAGLPTLDFRSIEGKKKRAYISAIQLALDRDYKAIIDVFSEVVKRSIKFSSSSR